MLKFLMLIPLILFSCAHQETAVTETQRSVSSAGPTLILDYQAGFQAGWTWLKVYSDGSMSHQEKICCPPHPTEVKEKPLTAPELKQLLALITESSSGKEETKEHVKLGLGEKIGTLIVYTANGQKFSLEDVTRTTPGTGTTVINTSPATKKIIDVIRKHSKNIILE